MVTVLSRTLQQNVPRRFCLLVAVHLVVLCAAYVLAFGLRFDFAMPAAMTALMWSTLLWVLPLKIVVFYRFGSLHGWWRYVSFADLAALLQASALSLLTVAAIDHFVIWEEQIPRVVLLLDFGALSDRELGSIRHRKLGAADL